MYDDDFCFKPCCEVQYWLGQRLRRMWKKLRRLLRMREPELPPSDKAAHEKNRVYDEQVIKAITQDHDFFALFSHLGKQPKEDDPK